ncbi:MAG: NUDIX domain-containing protein, partial [Armatimonadetes bacterium]|nr:NUDIX domain-containing protein [Armatimonadota bacterium]
LTASFYDPASKAEVVDALRAAVARHAPAAGSERLRRLLGDVMRAMVAVAVRDAEPPERGEAPAPDDHLRRQVLSRYPYPIAVAYAVFLEQRSPAAQYGSLLIAFESLVHYLAMVTVSAYFEALASGEAQAGDECGRRVLSRFTKNRWSTGDLYGLLCDTVRCGGNCGGLLPYAELPPYLYQGARATAENRILSGLVEARNGYIGHPSARTEKLYADALPEAAGLVEGQLARMPWLGGWELICPLTVAGGQVRRADRLMGQTRLESRDYGLPLQARDLDYATTRVHPERTLLLVSPDTPSRYLPLFPLSLQCVNLEASGVYLLREADWRDDRPLRRLHRVQYVAYGREEGKVEEDRSSPAIPALEQCIRRLESGHQPTAAAGEEWTDDTDRELPQVRHEQESHLRTFTGRREVLNAIESWVASTPGGYLLVTGGPGQGKSALAAAVAQRLSEGGKCLLHMVRSHRNPLRFLPSLIRQAARLADTRFPPDAYRDDIDDLRNSLVMALEVLTQSGDRAAVVIDALDELDPQWQRLAFLPSDLPDSVHVVLTTRPTRAVRQAAQAGLRQLREMPLDPLSVEELEDFVATHVRHWRGWAKAASDLEGQAEAVNAAIDWPALHGRLAGNPLFLRQAVTHVCTAVEAGSEAGAPVRLEVDEIPAQTEAVFQQIYDEITVAAETSANAATKARLVHLLSVAREALTIGQLTELLRAQGAELLQQDCRRLLASFSQYLLDVGGGALKPWHEGLSEHVQRAILGPEGCRELHGTFCAWLAADAAGLSRYGLRHRGAHLRSAGRLSELEPLLLDAELVAARLDAGFVFELVEDLADLHSSTELSEVAAAALRAALETKRPERFWLRLRGALRQHFGSYEQWPPSFRSELEASRDLGVRMFLAETHDMSERTDLSAAIMEAALEDLSPEVDPTAYAEAVIRLAYYREHLGQYREGLARLAALIDSPGAEERYGRSYWWAQYHQGINLSRIGHFREAIETLTRVRDRSSNEALETGALHQLGVLALQLGQPRSAEALFRQCIAERGHDDWNKRRAYEHRRLGQLQGVTGRFDEARRSFATALRISMGCVDRTYANRIRRAALSYVECPARLLIEPPERLEPAAVADEAFRGQPGFEGPKAADLVGSAIRDAFSVLSGLGCGYVEELDPHAATATGQAVRWDIAHRDGVWHGAVAVLIADARGRVALQTRSEDDSRGKSDLSATGHVDVGETDLEAAARETREEVGLLIPPERFVRVGEPYGLRKEGLPTQQSDELAGDGTLRYHRGTPNRERVSVFVVRATEADLVPWHADDPPPMALQWVSLAEAVSMARDGGRECASALRQVLGAPATAETVARIVEGVGGSVVATGPEA